MTSKLFAVYDPKHMDMNALDFLIEKWRRRRGLRIFPKLHDMSGLCVDARIKFQFGCGDVGFFEKKAFDEFYDRTRTKFFEDETKSTFRDALYELQPEMFEYFIKEMDASFQPPGYPKPVILEIDDEWLRNYNEKRKKIDAEEERHLLDAARQNHENSLQLVEQERQRRSKRLCVVQRALSAPVYISTKKRKVEDIIVVADEPNAPARKPRKSNFNSIQWKHLQVQARKQLHEAVLSYDFPYVQLIASEWEKESDEERRLDIDALEWAFRRICKQLLPHAAEKEANMRKNAIAMIEKLFECFRSMKLCERECMRLHIISICREVGNRSDIISHMMAYRCSCCLTIKV